MAFVSKNVFGGAEETRKYLVSASFATAGIVAVSDADEPKPLAPATTTNLLDSLGLTKDTATYSATPGAGATGIVTVAYRPFNVLSFRACGSATEGTALTLLTETAGDTSTPDLVTSSSAAANSMIGGTIWRYRGEGQAVGIAESRMISAHTASTSVGVTDDFERAINVGDQFVMVPWTIYPGDGTDTSDGNTNVQFTTNLYEADATIATGTGGICCVYDIIMKGANDSRVEIVLTDHPYFQFIS